MVQIAVYIAQFIVQRTNSYNLTKMFTFFYWHSKWTLGRLTKNIEMVSFIIRAKSTDYNYYTNWQN